MFRRDIARARTFGFLADVEQLWARGLARGASLDNAVVIGDDRVVNPEGLRFADEFVRHKALDAVGDLALAGAPILGCYRSYRGGHRLNIMAIDALIAERSAWAFVQDARCRARRIGAKSLMAALPRGWRRRFRARRLLNGPSHPPIATNSHDCPVRRHGEARGFRLEVRLGQ